MSVIKCRSFFKDTFHFVSQVNFSLLKTQKYIKKKKNKLKKSKHFTLERFVKRNNKI